MSEKQQTCPKCKGSGAIPVPQSLQDTLKRLRQCRRPITGAELARRIDVANSAMCNRLRKLESLGLAKPTHNGRSVLWEAVK